jgi:hypothetical protein
MSSLKASQKGYSAYGMAGINIICNYRWDIRKRRFNSALTGWVIERGKN